MSGAEARQHWLLDPSWTFLNHGSFGACPKPVLAAQDRFREELERQPLRFFVDGYEAKLDGVRAALSKLLGGASEDLVFVTNATTGVNTFLRAFPLAQGDEVLTTTHEYNASRNALAHVAQVAGARLVDVNVPFPLEGEDAIVESVLAHVTSRTRLALVDHITSPTALVFPIERLVRELKARGVETLVDGAHGPGMVDIDLDRIGAAAYTGNLHKWLCTPKGSAFLHVRRDWQERVRPLVTSHGYNSTRTDRPRFLFEFDWMGTIDTSAILAIPAAIDFLSSLGPGGFQGHLERNRALTLEMRTELAKRFGTALPCPDSLIGAMATIRLPAGLDRFPSGGPAPDADPVHQRLVREFRIEVPIISWPFDTTQRYVRISCQAYNAREDYQRLAGALEQLLG